MVSLRIQAEMFAAALGEGAIGGDTPMAQELVSGTANRIVIRMVETTNTRARLFRLNGQLIADSRTLSLAGRRVEVETLPPPDETPNILRKVFNIYDRLVKRLPGHRPLSSYMEQPVQHASHYNEISFAFRGDVASIVRKLGKDQLMLSVAVPVQRYKQVLGALLVTMSSQSIDQALYEVRVGILKLFLISLMLTTLLSIYLAGAIARPIYLLARAADRVRYSLNRREQLPDMSNRNDEIGDLANSLRDMTEALWDRMDAIEQFAADVSHEIKNPLASLKSAVETATRIKNPEQQRELMAIIQDDVVRLNHLIGDISDASRLDAELSRAAMGSVNISKMLQTLVDVNTSPDNYHDDNPTIILNIEADEADTLTAYGMESRLAQVFSNLIRNAQSFSPPGGIITLSAHKISPRESDQMTVIIISDQGPGIPAGKEQAIFDRFYSERPVKEKFGTHSGLGLSISKQIIDAHGGTLKVENILADDGTVNGARFIVTLLTG
jgi:two-component system sensor histidine kinase ChvG